MYAGFPEEGDKCPELGCGGVLYFPRVENCACHISPPCSACTDNRLTCNECGWTDDSPEETYIPVAPGLSMRELRPRPLDNTRVDWRAKLHTGSSMIKEGVYPPAWGDDAEAMIKVRAEVDGTFGGRFERFGGGKFKFIAYTD